MSYLMDSQEIKIIFMKLLVIKILINLINDKSFTVIH